MNNVRDVHRLPPSEPIRGPTALPEPRRLGADGYPDENAGAYPVAPRISFPKPGPPELSVQVRRVREPVLPSRAVGPGRCNSLVVSLAGRLPETGL